MKKSTIRVLSLVMALMMIVGTLAVVPFSAAGHEHTKGELVETVEPTCVLYGYSVYKCATCGQPYFDDVIDPTFEHDYQDVGEIPATCETSGVAAGIKCTKCGDIKEGCEILPPSHTLAYKINDLNDCEEKVNFVSYCRTCNKILDAEEIQKSFDMDDAAQAQAANDYITANIRAALVINSKNHDIKATVTKYPTCTEDGSADLSCTDCAFKLEGVVVEKLGHTYEFKFQEASFLGNEKWYRQCKDCGAIEKYTAASGTLHKKGDTIYYKEVAAGTTGAVQLPDKVESNGTLTARYGIISDETNVNAEGNANTNHYYLLTHDATGAQLTFDERRDIEAIKTAIDALKAGQSYEAPYTFNNKTYTAKASVAACTHKQWDDADYIFVYNKKDAGERATDDNKTIKMSDAEFAPSATETRAEKFFRKYAKYMDVATLYLVKSCHNSKCDETKKILVFNKAGHINDSYSFEIRTEFNGAIIEVRVLFDIDSQDPANAYNQATYTLTTDPYTNVQGESHTAIHYYAGYEKETYQCADTSDPNRRPMKQTLCAFCAARAVDSSAAALPVITTYLGTVQNHKYTKFCQNPECAPENAADAFLFDYNGDTVIDPETETFYICKNCDHAGWNVCLNKDTETTSNDLGLCLHIVSQSEAGGTTGVTSRHIADTSEEFVMPATCVEKAYLYYKCKKCGAPVKIPDSDFGKIDEGNHDFSNTNLNATVTRQAATCVAPGRGVRYCNRFGCNAWEPFEIPVDEKNGHALYTRDVNGVPGLSKADVDAIRRTTPTFDLDPRDIIPATCTTNKIEKWYCDLCKQIVYIEVENSKLDGTADKLNHKDENGKSTLKTVDKKDQNCTTGATYKYEYCTRCNAITAIDYNKDGTLDYTDARENVLAKKFNTVDNFDEIIVPNPYPALFTPDEWNGNADDGENAVYGGDAEIKFEAIVGDDGTAVTYKLTSGGYGHNMHVTPGYDATCTNAGLKDKYSCTKTDPNTGKQCTFIDKDDRNGAQIRPIAHKNAQMQSVKPGDEDRVKEEWLFEAQDVVNKDLQEIWGLRAIATRPAASGTADAYDYKVAYVPATCTEDGYFVGKYCPDCMAEIEGVKYEYFNATFSSTVFLKDEEGNYIYHYEESVGTDDEYVYTETEITGKTDASGKYYKPLNIAGYKFEKTGHTGSAFYDAETTTVCGENNYTYDVYKCTCDTYIVKNFAKPAHKAHKIAKYAANDDTLGVKRGDPIIYTLGAETFDKEGNPLTYVALKKDTTTFQDYYYYKLVKRQNAGLWYVDATATSGARFANECAPEAITYKGSICEYCGEFVEVTDKTESIGHYTTKLDGTQEAIKFDCKNFKDYVGLPCDACGYEVPNVVVEKDNAGRDIESYYPFRNPSLKLTGVDSDSDGEYDYYQYNSTGTKYFVINHNWAVDASDCEAYNAELRACADCKINVKNATQHRYHQYYNFTVTPVYDTTVTPAKLLSAGNKALNAFNTTTNKTISYLSNYKNYAFDDVVYPTASKEGLGTITCNICGKISEVTIPVYDATISASFDNLKKEVRKDAAGDEIINPTTGKPYIDEFEYALVGKEVTATVYVSAKDFGFHELKLNVSKIANEFELVDVELLYAFDEVDAVTAYKNDNGTQITIRTAGVAHKNVTVSGDKVPFLRLTFRTGDFTSALEYNDYTGLAVTVPTDAVTYLNSKGGIDSSYTGNIVPDSDYTDFGALRVYNPAYSPRNTVDVLAQTYRTDYKVQFDFNSDGTVDLDDYFAMVDFADSKKTIADFCELTGYDVEAMLDTLDYNLYSSKLSVDVTSPRVVDYTRGTDIDIDYAKAMIRRELAKADYKNTVIAPVSYTITDSTTGATFTVTPPRQTIKGYAQSLIDAGTL